MNTTQTVTVSGRNYTVETTDGEHVPYRLIGARGGRLNAVRNLPTGVLLILDSSGRDTGARFVDPLGRLVKLG